MNNPSKLILLLCFLSFACVTTAQEKASGGFKKNIFLAEEALVNKDYHSAVVYLEGALAKRDDEPEIMVQLANTYQKINNYQRAIYWYEKVLSYDGQKYRYVLYSIGNLQKSLGEYDEAMQSYRRFIATYSGPNSEDLIKNAEASIIGCKMAKLKGSNKKISLLTGELPDNIQSVSRIIDGKVFIGTTDEVYSASVEERNLMDIEPLDLKTANAITATYPAHNPTSNQILCSRCKDLGTSIDCELAVLLQNEKSQYILTKIDSTIGSEEGISSMPYLVEGDEEMTIYFASNRPGGYGGWDIWVAEVDEAFNLLSIENAGKNINTEANEITPFFDPIEQKLFFSSNRFTGFGGYDVYSVLRSKDKWKKANILSAPINSGANDVSYKYTEEGGLLVSNRNIAIADSTECVTCENRIYSFTKHFSMLEFNLTSKGIPLTSAQVHIINEQGDRIDQAEWAKKSDSHYPFRINREDTYSVHVFKDGYTNHLDTIHPETSLLQYDVDLQKLYTFHFWMFDELEQFPMNIHDVDWRFTYRAVDKEAPIHSYKMKDNFLEVRTFRRGDFDLMASTSGFYSQKVRVSSKKWIEPDSSVSIVYLTKIDTSEYFEAKGVVFYKDEEKDLFRETKTSIENLADELRRFPRRKVEIGALVYDAEEDEENLRLSQALAEEIVEQLKLEGVSSRRLIARGYGSQVTGNYDERLSKAQNNTVVFRYLGEL